MLGQPLQLGTVSIPNRAILAPLAGVTDVPFRRICQEAGAGLTYVEMLSAAAVLIGSEQTLRMICRHPSEPVLGVQLTGKTPEEVAKASRYLADRDFDTLDINMGCPVRKVVKSGMGSAFLCDPERITATMEATVAAVPIPVTMKTRIGFHKREITVEDTAARAARAGAVMLTLHGRTRECTYGDPVQHEWIRAGAAAARRIRPDLVICGNGNVLDRASANAMMRDTGCDCVMVSRGALGNPWIFEELVQGRTGQPTIGEWREVVRRHLAYHEEHHGGHVTAVRTMRKHLIWYAKGFPNSSRFRLEAGHVDDFAAARALVDDFAAALPGTYRRFDEGGRNLREASETDPKWSMDRELDRGVGHDGLAA